MRSVTAACSTVSAQREAQPKDVPLRQLTDWRTRRAAPPQTPSGSGAIDTLAPRLQHGEGTYRAFVQELLGLFCLRSAPRTSANRTRLTRTNETRCHHPHSPRYEVTRPVRCRAGARRTRCLNHHPRRRAARGSGQEKPGHLDRIACSKARSALTRPAHIRRPG